MASSATGAARGSMYRQYSRGSSGSISVENLPPRTLARVAREIRDLQKNPPEGVRLVVDSETGVPSSLGEVLVSGVSSNKASLDRSRCPILLSHSGVHRPIDRDFQERNSTVFRVRVPNGCFHTCCQSNYQIENPNNRHLSQPTDVIKLFS